MYVQREEIKGDTPSKVKQNKTLLSVQMANNKNVLELHFVELIVIRSAKMLALIPGKAKTRPAVLEHSQGSMSRDGPKLRRSLGLDTFPNVLLFRTCMQQPGECGRPILKYH